MRRPWLSLIGKVHGPVLSVCDSPPQETHQTTKASLLPGFIMCGQSEAAAAAVADSAYSDPIVS